ncbi:MAG: homoserine O-succinyltransferase [Candidatus Competibacterales bacterium]|nr:homoserine O-succinyltransferase [Candidatus Competibacterales bacterium]
MPLVAHSPLPTFDRLAHEGEDVLDTRRARQQDIRELHIGLLNMMPDAALAPTERQFMRLVGACNRIVQFYVHPFTFNVIERSPEAAAYLERYYEPFDTLAGQGLDALIITGANPLSADITAERFWPSLTQVLDWARERVTSVLCACLATHATVRYFHDIVRQPLPVKRWGVYSHRVMDRVHPLVRNINTRFDVPHSRWNAITREQLDAAGIDTLVESETAGVHLAVSPDMIRFVYFQGHPEYDRNSLLKEYKREVSRFLHGDLADYPPEPEHYFDRSARPLLDGFRDLAEHRRDPALLGEFPEAALLQHTDNTWSDTAKTVVNNWLGTVYQLTHQDRRRPFMDGIDPEDPLGLRGHKPEPEL